MKAEAKWAKWPELVKAVREIVMEDRRVRQGASEDTR